MKILIDADGCPVVNLTIKLAKKYSVPCILICDTSHHFESIYARVVVVSKGSDSVDFALVNMAQDGDIVITQDYGLAAMCLSKRAVPINQDGMIYNNSNIDSLLLKRHTAKKLRSSGSRLRGPKKRLSVQNKIFEQTLSAVIQERLV